MRFQDKVAFITGGARGIGFQFAQDFVKEGAAIVIADVDRQASAEAVAALKAMGGRALAVYCDVGDESVVDEAVAEAVKAFGGVDFLINNAARHLMAYAAPLTQMSRAMWRDMLNINVVGIVNCSASCRTSMKQRGGGVIINLVSISGLNPNIPYGISKLCVRGLTYGLAHELASDGIRVFGICPGVMDSPAAMAEVPKDLRDKYINELQLIKRQGRMSDLTGALFFFCSEDSSFITGEMLVVAGGAPLRL